MPLLAAGLTLFVVLCTLNSAGYRYGASDQAFYAPAVIRALHPDYYPRDAPLIDAQARLTARRRGHRRAGPHQRAVPAGRVRAVLRRRARALRTRRRRRQPSALRARLATIALLAALTLRHAIAETGTNTLEGYFHPRQIAFAFGAWAVAGFLRGRAAASCAAAGGGRLIHPTTALWFIIWLAVAGQRRRQAPADPGRRGTADRRVRGRLGPHARTAGRAARHDGRRVARDARHQDVSLPARLARGACG